MANQESNQDKSNALEVQRALDDHQRWLTSNGSEGKRLSAHELNFSGMDLSSADFRRADLVGANFQAATLEGASFMDAALRRANFRGAYAPFQGADIRDTDFTDANLDLALFPGSNQEGTKMEGVSDFLTVKTDGDERALREVFLRDKLRKIVDE